MVRRPLIRQACHSGIARRARPGIHEHEPLEYGFRARRERRPGMTPVPLPRQPLTADQRSGCCGRGRRLVEPEPVGPVHPRQLTEYGATRCQIGFTNRRRGHLTIVAISQRTVTALIDISYVANDLVLTLASADGATTDYVTPPSGYTLARHTDSGGDVITAIAYKKVAATGSEGVTGLLAGNGFAETAGKVPCAFATTTPTKRNSQFSEEIVYNSKISSFATNLFAR